MFHQKDFNGKALRTKLNVLFHFIKVHWSFINEPTVTRRHLGYITVNGKGNFYQSVLISVINT